MCNPRLSLKAQCLAANAAVPSMYVNTQRARNLPVCIENFGNWLDEAVKCLFCVFLHCAHTRLQVDEYKHVSVFS